MCNSDQITAPGIARPGAVFCPKEKNAMKEKILVIDDDIYIRQNMEKLLQMKQFAVRSAASVHDTGQLLDAGLSGAVSDLPERGEAAVDSSGKIL